MRRLAFIAALFALLAPSIALAVTPSEMLKDPALEARARHLSSELRCMVCQNESIDDSDAPLAHDLRVLVRQRDYGGDSDKQVLDFWWRATASSCCCGRASNGTRCCSGGLPPAALLAGLVGIFFAMRRRNAGSPGAAGADGGRAATDCDFGRTPGRVSLGISH